MVKISKIKTNPKNPRIIKDVQFYKLVESIKAFPKMMELRPIIVDDEWIIVGGNMRHKALIELGYKEIPQEWVKQAKQFTEEELQQFIIKDNLSYGEWDWDAIANEWNMEKLDEWGMQVPEWYGAKDVELDGYEIKGNDSQRASNSVTLEFTTEQMQYFNENIYKVHESKEHAIILMLEHELSSK